jgi:PTH1 family peptidyl-tRNA hydrolase
MPRRLLFVGLGNPDPEYRYNRHNVGFMMVDEIARRHGVASWRRDSLSHFAEIGLQHERIVLLKPRTYMNLSGDAVRHAMRYFEVALSDITVFHDEIELPPGKLRVKVGGGIAGHNGLRSISSQIGNEYRRVRFGVGRPAEKRFVERYVLGDFAKSERPWVEALVETIADNVALLAANHDSSFQNKVHLAMQAKGFFDKGDDGAA